MISLLVTPCNIIAPPYMILMLATQDINVRACTFIVGFVYTTI